MREIILRLIEFVILFAVISNDSFINKIETQNGFIQSSVVVWLQGIAAISYIVVSNMLRYVNNSIDIKINIKNELYQTESSMIFYRNDKDHTHEDERNIVINIKFSYRNIISKKFIEWILKNKILKFEIIHPSLELSSNDAEIEETINGFYYSLNRIIESQIKKTRTATWEKNIKASFIIDENILEDCDSDIYIYPVIWKQDENKEAFLSRIFIKFIKKEYLIKIITHGRE